MVGDGRREGHGMIGAFQAGALSSGTLWTPAYAGVKWWIDASDTKSITLVSGNVSQINDKSGNGYHATQGTAAARPTPISSAWNGLQGIEFTANTDWLQSTVTGFNSLSAAYFYIVTKPVEAAAANTTTNAILSYGNIGGAGGGYPYNKGYRFFLGTGTTSGETIGLYLHKSDIGKLGSSTYSRSANTADIINVSISGSGTSIGVNGNSHTLDLSYIINTSTDVTPSAIGYTNDNIIWIHARVANAIFGVEGSTTTLLEIILSTTSTNHDKIIGYLAHKWGLSGSLPTDHPYKNVAPFA